MTNPEITLKRFDMVIPDVVGEAILVTRMIIGTNASDIKGDKAVYNVWKWKPDSKPYDLPEGLSYDEFITLDIQAQALIRENKIALPPLIHLAFPESEVGGKINTLAIVLEKVSFTAWWNTEGKFLEPQESKTIQL